MLQYVVWVSMVFHVKEACNLRFHRHAALNDVIHWSLSSAGIPACLEPSGLSRSDGKRLDGLTLVPWERGRPMVWDITVLDSMAPSYRSAAVSGTGSAAVLRIISIIMLKQE